MRLLTPLLSLILAAPALAGPMEGVAELDRAVAAAVAAHGGGWMVTAEQAAAPGQPSVYAVTVARSGAVATYWIEGGSLLVLAAHPRDDLERMAAWHPLPKRGEAVGAEEAVRLAEDLTGAEAFAAARQDEGVRVRLRRGDKEVQVTVDPRAGVVRVWD